MRKTALLALFALAAFASAKEMTVVDTDGLAKAIAAHPAKVKVVNFWASWCLPCRMEFPDLVKFRKQYHERGAEVIFVCTDFDEGLPSARRLLAQHGVDWTSYLARDKAEELIAGMDDEWTGALPATFIFGPDDKLRHAWHGRVHYEELAAAVDAVLAGKKIPATTTDKEH